MTDALSLLHASLGVPGSGRVRYGAAMALYREGLLTEPQLEVYREASAHDARDPAPILAERGLPPVPRAVTGSPIRALYDAARDYLLTLHHPGAADVRMGLPTDPGPERSVTQQPNPVVTAWLDTALKAVASTRPALAQIIRSAAPHLHWVTYDAYPRALIGDAFATGHAFASIRGEAAPFVATDFDLGLFLIAPRIVYRDHHHAAPELYAPLTGPHDWRFAPGDALHAKPAHAPVWNPPHRPHLTRTGHTPFLAFFVWTRDVNQIAEVIPAPDWPDLEATFA